MLSRASCQLMLTSTAVTPMSMRTLIRTSGMAWATNCSSRVESFTVRDMSCPVCLSS